MLSRFCATKVIKTNGIRAVFLFFLYHLMADFLEESQIVRTFEPQMTKQITNMKKIITLLMTVLLSTAYSMACTNFIVGKKASVDGSVICSYNADSYGAFMNLAHYPAAKHAKGDMRKIYEWDTNKYLGEIPEAPETYNVIGNINEWQVTIGETTYGGREEMVDSFILVCNVPRLLVRPSVL